MAGPSDPQFQKLVAERVAAGNPEREDSPAYLLKRLKELEQGNATLRQAKRSRPEDSAAELEELVTELNHRSCAPDFPAQCAAALEHLSALIEDATDRGSFGLAQSTADGKALVRILVLAAVRTKHGEALQPHGAPRCARALLARVGRRRRTRSAPTRRRRQHQELASVQSLARRVEAAKAQITVAVSSRPADPREHRRRTRPAASRPRRPRHAASCEQPPAGPPPPAAERTGTLARALRRGAARGYSLTNEVRLRRTAVGWVAASVARACPAAARRPGVGAPLLESCASAARAAALGGVWQLGAAGCCKRRGTRSCARVQPRARQRTFPCGSSGVVVPVLWSCTVAALSQRATGPRSGRGATLPEQRRVARAEQAGVQRPVARAAWAASRGLA